ncbi:hypothetical protein [Actinomadura geliboluensis]|nr:hypothetical protein [Actinomadura geliboluensis]
MRRSSIGAGIGEAIRTIAAGVRVTVGVVHKILTAAAEGTSVGQSPNS